MELDWQCDQPNELIQANSEPQTPQTSDPNVEYIFELCSSIKEKLELLQQAVGREELTEYAESHLKNLITDLIEIETKITGSTESLNIISDTLNNLASQSEDGQPVMINGLINL